MGRNVITRNYVVNNTLGSYSTTSTGAGPPEAPPAATSPWANF
ncbi:MAG: hypothetical protein AAF628_25040 [Planctomycetota bacterium]